MAATAAQLLDELMGRDRDRPASERRAQSKWDDPDVCKYNLCGFCPHDLFVNTRADLGICERLHDDPLQAEYQKSSRFGRMGYEEDMVRFLQTLIAEVERRIRRGHQRLLINSKQGSLNMSPPQSSEERVHILTEKINDLVAQAEELGCEGKVEEAQGMMKLCDQLIAERQQLESANTDAQSGTSEFEKTMEVCDVCGALLVVGDAQQRIDEHLMGKQHMGYARIRAYVEGKKIERQQKQQAVEDEMEARLTKEREEREKEREKEREEREERRKREEEREKEQKKEKEQRRKSRSRDREKRRDRSKDRKRSSSRDRNRRRRSRSRERRRSRSRDRAHKSGGHRVRRSRSRDRRSRSKPSHGSRHKSRSRSKDRRAEGRRPDDKRSDERQSDERRSDERRSDERRSGDKRDDERRDDKRRDDDRRDDDRHGEKHTDENLYDEKLGKERSRSEDDGPVNGNSMMEHSGENDMQTDTNSIDRHSALDSEQMNKDE